MLLSDCRRLERAGRAAVEQAALEDAQPRRFQAGVPKQEVNLDFYTCHQASASL
jgi:hypothetical protein